MAEMLRLIKRYRFPALGILLSLLLASILVPEDQGNPAPWATPPSAYKTVYSDLLLRTLDDIDADDESSVTITTGGNITVTQFRHTVATQGHAASDDLDTISGGDVANIVILRAALGNETVVVKHNTGNIWLQGGSDVSLDDLEDAILLGWDTSNDKWFDIAAGGSGGGGGGNCTAAFTTIDAAQGTDPVASTCSGTLIMAEGEGIDVTGDSATDTVTIAGEDASTTNKGIVSFAAGHFSVTSGAASLLADGIDDTLIDWGSGANQVDSDDVPEGSTNLFVTAAHVGGVSANLDDTDASVEWEDANDLDANGDVADDSHNHVIGNIDAFTKSALEGQTSDVSDFAEADGDTWTGVHDAGGADSFEPPNGTNPTTDADGEIAVDTNDSAIEVYSESASRLIPTIIHWERGLTQPETVQANNDAIPLLCVESGSFPHGIKLTNVGIKTMGNTTYAVNFEEWTSPADGAPSTIEAVTTDGGVNGYEAQDDGTLTDSDIAVGSIIMADLPTTDINLVVFWIEYYIVGGN